MSDNPDILRSFSQWLATIEDGRLHAELSDDLRDIVAQLHDAAGLSGGKAKGEMTLKFAFNMEGGLVEVTADHSFKTPKLKRGRSIYWATPENNLTRRNPAQPDLPFRDVAVPPARNLA